METASSKNMSDVRKYGLAPSILPSHPPGYATNEHISTYVQSAIVGYAAYFDVIFVVVSAFAHT